MCLFTKVIEGTGYITYILNQQCHYNEVSKEQDTFTDLYIQHGCQVPNSSLGGLKCVARGINLLQIKPEEIRPTANFLPPTFL